MPDETWKLVSEHLKTDKALAISLMSKYPSEKEQIFRYLSADLRDDEEVVLACDGAGFEAASERLKEDRTFALRLLRKAEEPNEVFKELSPQLRSNSQVILAARAYGFECTPEFFKKDKYAVLNLLQTLANGQERIFEHIHSNLQDEDALIFAANGNGFKWVSERFKSNKTLLLQLINQPYSNKKQILQHLSEDMSNDEDILLALITQEPACRELINQKWQENKEFVFKVSQSLLQTAQNRSKTISPKIIESHYDQLKNHSYSKPTKQHQELLKQIDYYKGNLGRIKLSPTRSTPTQISAPITTIDSFSSIDHSLARELRNYFGSQLALFEFSIFCTSETPKGVIISHYGGYAKDHNLSSKDINTEEQQFIDEGYVLIHLITHDKWQTIEQWRQIDLDDIQGNKLLDTTLSQLLLFSSAVKKAFGLPLIYYGASFGGYKGALVNLLLANKDFLNFDPVALSLFREVIPVLSQTAPTVFDSIITHDGAFHYLLPLMDLFMRPIQTPMLILQNYDDQRVQTSEALWFISQQPNAGVNQKLIHFHITPQGGSGPVQMPDHNSSSLEAHFFTQSEAYAKERIKAIKLFLRDSMSPLPQVTEGPTSLLTVRADHYTHLYGDEIKNKLYRLYYAILHNESEPEPHSKNRMISRLQSCFSTMAQLDNRPDKTKVYEELVLLYGAEIIADLLKKRQQTFSLLKPQNPTSSQTFGFFKERPTAKEFSHQFILSQDAEEFLSTQKDPIKLINLCRRFVTYIEKSDLEFFMTHSEITNLQDFCNLFRLPPPAKQPRDWLAKLYPLQYGEEDTDFEEDSSPELTIPLPLASRLMSLIRLYYENPKEQIQIIECIQHVEPMMIIDSLGPHHFSIAEMHHFINQLAKQPSINQWNFIRCINRLCNPINECMKIALIDFLAEVPAEFQEKVTRNYLIVAEVLKWDDEQLSRIRNNPQLIMNVDFDTMEELDTFLDALKNATTKIQP